MSILRSSSAVFALFASTIAAAMPAAAQFSPQAGGSYGQAGIYGQAPATSSVVIGGSVQIGTPSSLIIQGRNYGGYYPYPQTSPVIIIQQPAAPVYYPQSYCTTSVIGSPIPTPYARDSVTGALCR
jgi:hypothetical protein